MTTCPKCRATSGDDWSQCRGSCPMPGSPHYRSEEQRLIEQITAERQAFEQRVEPLVKRLAQIRAEQTTPMDLMRQALALGAPLERSHRGNESLPNVPETSSGKP